MHEFNIMEAIVKMAEVALAIEEETHKALERAATVVEAEAKASIGSYQPEAGPFAEWAQLADSTLAEKEKLGYAPPDNPLLREGTLRDSIGHVVSGHEAAVGSNSDVAVYQELGTRRMPPRSFLGGAAVRKEGEVVELLGEGAVAGLIGEEVVNRYLAIRG
jgi:HK97 gp10 family phage protein